MNENQNQGINRKLTEAWACQDLYAEYKGCEVDESDFVDFEAIFGGPSVKALFTILDNAGFTSTLSGVGADPKEGGEMIIGYTDCLGCPIKHTFIIDGIITQTDKKDQKLVTIQLVDSTSRKMQTTYQSKGYPDKEYNKVIKEHLVKAKVDDVKIYPPTKPEQKKNMVIGAGQDFAQVLKGTGIANGYNLLMDRSKKYFVHQEHQQFGKLTNDGEVFTYDTDALAANRIVQFEVDGYKSDNIMKSVETKTITDDDQSILSKDNKEGVAQGYTPKKAKETENVKNVAKGKKVDEVIPQNGKKEVLKSNEQAEYYNALKGAQKLKIWVPGRNINRVGVKCEVNLPRPKFYTQDKFDAVFSGEWECYYVRDKIIGWYFMQELFLRRPGK